MRNPFRRARIAAAHVVTIAVTELPSEFRTLQLKIGRRQLVRIAIGFHPLRAGAAARAELDVFARRVDGTEYVGEIGLDLSRDGKPSARRQIDVFETILSLPAIRKTRRESAVDFANRAGIPVENRTGSCLDQPLNCLAFGATRMDRQDSTSR